MKRLTLALFVISCAIALTQKADANVVHVQYETAPGQAAALVTQPAMINSAADNTINQANRLKQIANSIDGVHNQPSQSINPSDFLKNPSAAVKQFFRSSPNQTSQRIDPLGVSKIPPLDSENIGSISVPVTHF